MKSFLLLTLMVFSTLTFGQSEPITSLQGDQGTKFSSPKLVVPNQQATKTAKGGRIETGSQNLLQNPSFESSVAVANGWTLVNGACASSSGVTVDGIANCLFTSSGTNWSIRQTSTINAPRLAGQEMEGSMWVGAVTNTDPIWLCPEVNGVALTASVANGCMQYTNIGSPQLLKVYFLGGATSNGIRLSGSNSATAVGVDRSYTGLRTNSEVSGESNTPLVPCTFSSLAWTGFATVTNNLQCKRSGPNLQIKGTFTIGTSTGSTVVIPLPNNFGSISIRSNGTYHVGEYFRTVSAVTHGGAIIALTGTDTLNLRMGGSGAFGSNNFNPMAPAIGTDIAASSEVLSVEANIPIAEWQNNINAFTLKCDDPRTCRTGFSAKVSSANAITDQTTGTAFPWLASASWSSGTLTITPTTGMFTVTPNCWAISKVQGQRTAISSESSTSISFTNRSNDGTANVNGDVNVFCEKQGADEALARITAQIVQMREYNRTPGVTSPILCSSFISNTTNNNSPCNSATCAQSYVSGGCFTSVTRSAAGRFSAALDSSVIVPVGAKCWAELDTSTGGGGLRVFRSITGITSGTTRAIAFDDNTATGSDASFTLFCHGVRP